MRTKEEILSEKLDFNTKGIWFEQGTHEAMETFALEREADLKAQLIEKAQKWESDLRKQYTLNTTTYKAIRETELKAIESFIKLIQETE